MSTSTAVAPRPALSPVLPTKRWTTAEFDELLAKGIIREGSRTFLWAGEIIEPMSENQPHRNAVANLFWLLAMLLPKKDWIVDQNGPLPLKDGYKPQPDLVIIRGPRSRYVRRVPGPEDVAFLVEFSESTYRDDSGEMLREYAAAGIAQYWIVNIPARRVEVYTNPGPAADGTSGYRNRVDYPMGETVPVKGEHGGILFDLGGVPVEEILRDSLEPEAG